MFAVLVYKQQCGLGSCLRKSGMPKRKRSAFGKYIRDRRMLAELTLRNVAEGLGISAVYLGEVERGLRPPLNRARYWNNLVWLIPGVTLKGLEESAARSQKLEVPIPQLKRKEQELALAFFRKLQDRSFSAEQLGVLRKMLLGNG